MSSACSLPMLLASVEYMDQTMFWLKWPPSTLIFIRHPYSSASLCSYLLLPSLVSTWWTEEILCFSLSSSWNYKYVSPRLIWLVVLITCLLAFIWFLLRNIRSALRFLPSSLYRVVWVPYIFCVQSLSEDFFISYVVWKHLLSMNSLYLLLILSFVMDILYVDIISLVFFTCVLGSCLNISIWTQGGI